MTILMNPEIDAQVATQDALASAQGDFNEEREECMLPRTTVDKDTGSIGQMAARSKLSYV
jgi:hypothetical protein